MNGMIGLALASVRQLVVITVVLGLGFPLLIWGVGHLAPGSAGGSLVRVDGVAVGSQSIGQQFSGATYFWGRPSAGRYDPMASGGSNAGPNSDSLTADVNQRRQAIAKANGVSPEQVPADALTASGSGLDPLISTQYAELQVNRIAKARGLTPAQVEQVVRHATKGRSLGFLGNPGVNVLLANVELDRLR